MIAEIVSGVATGCLENGCALIGGETASLPGIYHGDDYDLVGFIVGRVHRDELLDPESTDAGDVLIALPSSGLHTNGYSLIRSIFNTDDDPSSLFDEVPGDGRLLGDALLAPHKSYLKQLKPILNQIKSMAHITGGSFAKNVPRALGGDVGAKINVNSWSVPPLFDYIRQVGEIEDQEMYNVFNMGVGMIVCAAPDAADSVLRALGDAWVIGETTEHRGSEDRIVLV